MAKYPNGVLLYEIDRESYETADDVDIELWRLFKEVREGQLLDWKESDESYLAFREQEIERRKREAV